MAKQLYIARDATEAHKLQTFLAAQCIEAKINGNNSAEPETALVGPGLGVFVDEGDWEEANRFLAQFANESGGKLWRGEQPPRDSVEPLIPGANRSAPSVWFEVCVVAALTMPIYSGSSLTGFVVRTLSIRNTESNFYVPAILRNVLEIFIVLAAIRISRDPWSAFGIKKVTMLDLFNGGIVCVISIAFPMMGGDIFEDILKSMFGEHYVYQLTHMPRASYHAHGAIGLGLLLVLSCLIGFSEELFARGYLIPRLERLLRSTWVCVLVSSAVFGMIHWRSGVLSVCDAFLAGIVFGIAFVWTRSLWPVAIAHALYDFSIFLSRSG